VKRLTLRRIRGDYGEAEAARFLRKNGYRLVERNFSALGCEIDLIVKNREYLAFVEVKTRRLDPSTETTLTKPAAAVDREKQRHLVRAAKCYLAQSAPIGKKCRFDVVEVYLDPKIDRNEVIEIHHIKGAFFA
jgi:putative endonuclease